MQNSDQGQGEQLESLKARAVFGGLVFNEAGEPARVVSLGGVDHYAIPDQGFLWHVEAYRIDDVVLDEMQRQLGEVRPQVVEMMLDMLGRRDIFTKAALDASVENLAVNVRRSDTVQWATMLGLAGFRIVVNHRGEVHEIVFPSQPEDEGD
ncbi:MAG: hypothetical protein ACOX3S_06890 [Anaerolineae bacterium]|jgi:hypothetical protein